MTPTLEDPTLPRISVRDRSDYYLPRSGKIQVLKKWIDDIISRHGIDADYEPVYESRIIVHGQRSETDTEYLIRLLEYHKEIDLLVEDHIYNQK